MKSLFKNAISVSRLGTVVGTNKEEYKPNGTIYGIILPIDAESVMLSEGNPSKTYILYTYHDSDIKETDKVSYNSINYIVAGIRTFNLWGIKVKEVIIEELES